MVFQTDFDQLSNLARTVFAIFTPEAERKKLEYTLSMPQDLKDTIYLDTDRLQDVMSNFISNAVKYTDKGKIDVILSQPTSATVKFEVKDTGPGISVDEQNNLFHKFYRVESNVGKTTGTGLGLYISKLLVEKFGGKIGVNSEIGKGSTFWFELPIAQNDQIKTTASRVTPNIAPQQNQTLAS